MAAGVDTKVTAIVVGKLIELNRHKLSYHTMTHGESLTLNELHRRILSYITLIYK